MKWEYLIQHEHGGDTLMRRSTLEKLGKRGWELCGVIQSEPSQTPSSSGWPGVVQFIFKRPILTRPTPKKENDK